MTLGLPKQAVNELARFIGDGEEVRYPEFLTALRVAADELLFAEEAPSEYGDDDVEDEDATSLNKVPSPNDY